MAFDIDDFIGAIQASTDIIAEIGEYNGEPAIAERFPSEPDETYISICDRDLDRDFCQNGTMVKRGTWVMEITIVGTKETTRSEMRAIFDVVWCFLNEITDEGTYRVRLDSRSNQEIDPDTERPYISSIFTVFF